MKLSQSPVARFVTLAFGGHAAAGGKFRVGYLTVMDGAQAIVAREGGICRKYDLEAELGEFKSGADLINAIVGDRVDSSMLGRGNVWRALVAPEILVGFGNGTGSNETVTSAGAFCRA